MNKAGSLIFRKITQNEFKAITNTINSIGGGSQTYVDFPKGSISDEEFQEFFDNSGVTIDGKSYSWNFKVNSLSLGRTQQEETISTRRDSSNSLREQNNEKRIEILKPNRSNFPSNDYDSEHNPIILFILKDELHEYWAGWFYRESINDDWFLNKSLSAILFKDCGYIKLSRPIAFDSSDYTWPFGKSDRTGRYITPIEANYSRFIDALKTKPFLLLAGISGTGKSRKVKELAYMTCPEGELRQDATSPGNYCLIEVKPNWHDSTELLGYYSNLSGKYNITPFIHFAYKAIQNPDVPFFVCLDEMNLAPVEQYFAEYLSVLETRTMQGEKIESAELLNRSIFDCCSLDDKGYSAAEREVLEYLKGNGLRLPENLFIIGTVNMDDTTHQFSRKVIDRAFTIEMNGDALSSMFDEDNAKTLMYAENPLPFDCLKPKYVTALEALSDGKITPVADIIKAEVPKLLGNINETLKTTPFRVSFRVQNELILYLTTLILNSEQDVNNESVVSLIKAATLVILLEKILPRVQGDNNLLGSSLDNLTKEVETGYSELSDSDVYKEVISKLDEMKTRLKDSYFTNFF